MLELYSLNGALDWMIPIGELCSLFAHFRDMFVLLVFEKSGCVVDHHKQTDCLRLLFSL